MDRPLLYRIWFRRYRRRKNQSARLPCSGDMLYLDGFPRSGNTYFCAAVQSLYPTFQFAHHLHCLAPLRIAINNKVPSFVLMRSPKDAIASRYLSVRSWPSSMSELPRDELIDRLVDDWARYYRFCERHLSHVSLIAFEDAVGNTFPYIYRMAELAGFNTDEISEIVFQRFHERFRQRDRSKSQGSTSFPDAIRTKEKEAVLSLVERSSAFEKAVKTYDRLKPQSMAVDQPA